MTAAAAPRRRATAGLNTLLYSASASPVPDIVAMVATAQNDGILHITGNFGGLCGSDGEYGGERRDHGPTANTGSATLPLVISICQTNPTTGQCLAAPIERLIDDHCG